MMPSNIVSVALGATLVGQAHAFPALPAPLCDKLKAKEDAVVTGVCAKQTKVPADQCEAMVKQGFEKILEKECPSELEAFPAFPAPLCDKLKAKEDAVVTGVCAKQTKVPAEQCEAMVKQGFEKILEKQCPSELEAFPAFPAPLCDKLKENEDAVVTGICSKQTKVPTDQCAAKVKEGLDKIISTQCSGQVEATPLPANLCDDMKDKEDDFVSGMCAKQHLVPVMTCETNAKQSFDMLLAKVCPTEVIVV